MFTYGQEHQRLFKEKNMFLSLTGFIAYLHCLLVLASVFSR